MNAIRSQLDELFGKDRNLTPSERAKRQPHFSDDEICKSYICGLCPNELFVTDPCTKLHDEDCLKQYQQCKDKEQYGYEREWAREMDRIIQDNDKKVKKNKERLILDAAKLEAEEGLNDGGKEFAKTMADMEERIQALLKKSEELGEEGQITEAQELMDQAEKLKAEKLELEKAEELKDHNKKMSVCDICGALLFVGDKEKRSQSHLEGKKHVGFAKLRAHMEEYFNNKRNSFQENRGHQNQNNYHNQRYGGDNQYQQRRNYNNYNGGGGAYRNDRGGDRDSRSGGGYSRNDYHHRGGDYNNRNNNNGNYYKRDREYRDRDHPSERDRDNYSRR